MSGAPADDFQPTIDRLRAIAAASGEHLLLGDGPPHPDHALLDICGEALHCLVQAEKLACRARATRMPGDHPAFREPWKQSRVLQARATRLMGRARKMRATTPAGIYAKAQLVRASETVAGEFARSLAKDLVECAPLRASLWPVQAEPGA